MQLSVGVVRLDQNKRRNALACIEDHGQNE